MTMTATTVPPAITPGRSIAAAAWKTLAIAALAVFVVSLDTTVLFVAFPSIRRTFPGVSSEALSWVLNAYTIGYGALLVPAGRLADRFGRRAFFLAGIAVFTLASVLCGIAPGVATMVAARALQSLGAAMLMPGSLALVLHAFPAERLLPHRAVAPLDLRSRPLDLARPPDGDPRGHPHGRLADRIGYRPLFVAGGLLFSAGAAWLLFSRTHEAASFLLWLPGSILMGAAIGMILPSLSGAAASDLDAATFGVGGGVNQAVRQFGSVLGVAIVVALLGSLGRAARFENVFLLRSQAGFSPLPGARFFRHAALPSGREARHDHDTRPVKKRGKAMTNTRALLGLARRRPTRGLRRRSRSSIRATTGRMPRIARRRSASFPPPTGC
jgi:MFS family permease